MMFQVESGVPLAAVKRGRKPVEFPFPEMDVGDSFLVPCDVNDKKALTNWRRKIAMGKKAFGLGTFATATMSDGVRVWRTA